MRIEQFMYLIEVSRTLSISKASENLHITRTALSLSLKSLENELNIQLLERVHQGVFLTSAGEQIVEGAEKFLKLVQKLQNQNHDDELEGLIDFYCCFWVSELILPQFNVEMGIKYPRMQLSPVIIQSENSLRNMIDEPKEFALTLKTFHEYDYKSNNDSINFTACCTMYLYAQVHPKFSIGSYRSISLNTLMKYPILLVQNSEESSYLLNLLDNRGYEKKIIFASNKALYDKMLHAGLGVGLNYFPNLKAALDATPEPLKVIPISEKESCEFGYLTHKNFPLTNNSKIFLEKFFRYFDQLWHIQH